MQITIHRRSGAVQGLDHPLSFWTTPNSADPVVGVYFVGTFDEGVLDDAWHIFACDVFANGELVRSGRVFRQLVEAQITVGAESV